jgi:glutamate-1-semialdehyde 2,1-aminomutase
MPGGVSSPVRAFGAVPGDPPLVASANGAEIVDCDGKRYVDLVGSWGPLILGHAHPAVVEAVTQAARNGLTYGATCRGEVELAEALLEHYSFGERVRFVSSGTEAVMSAVRLARGATGRARIVKFEGCYHGHSDGLLVKAGSGLATLGTPTSAGVPAQIAELTDVCPLNDVNALTRLFDEKGADIAAILVEPMPANAGLLLQTTEYLTFLRDLTRKHGALLIFDEVISGFRVALGGMTELTGLTPDLVTLGKIVGGGMPVGAYVGRADLMEQVAPNGPVYQAGTLSGNPLAMAAGLATLHELKQPGVYEGLEETGGRLQQGIQEVLARHSIPANVVRMGSVLWLNLQEGDAPRDFSGIDGGSAERYGRIHGDLMERGVWMAPSAYEVAFLSTAHTPEHVGRILEAFEASVLQAREALV